MISKHCTILFFRSQILSLSFVKIMSQIQSLSFCSTFSVKWATILSWSRSDLLQSFQKVRFTTKIFILRQYFGVLFFKNILYQKRTFFQAGIVEKKIWLKYLPIFWKILLSVMKFCLYLSLKRISKDLIYRSFFPQKIEPNPITITIVYHV